MNQFLQSKQKNGTWPERGKRPSQVWVSHTTLAVVSFTNTGVKLLSQALQPSIQQPPFPSLKNKANIIHP